MQFCNTTSISLQDYFCFQFIDTSNEKAIGLGVDYPYEPLKAGECIVNSGALAKHPDLVIGSIITFDLPYDEFMNTAKSNYNAYFKEP